MNQIVQDIVIGPGAGEFQRLAAVRHNLAFQTHPAEISGEAGQDIFPAGKSGNVGQDHIIGDAMVVGSVGFGPADIAFHHPGGKIAEPLLESVHRLSVYRALGIHQADSVQDIVEGIGINKAGRIADGPVGPGMDLGILETGKHPGHGVQEPGP